MRRSITVLAAASAALLLPAGGAFGQEARTFTAELGQANNSGASGTVTIELDGTTADISIRGQGFFDGFPHALHLHGEPGGDNVCGPLNPGDAGFDEASSQNLADGTPILSVADGAPSYGGVAVSLTTEGDTSPDSALDVDRFPTSGTLDYNRTIDLPQAVADDLTSLHVVVHATDLNGDGEIGPVEDEDGEEIPSSLDPELPIEATAPAACGQIVSAAGAGTGIATGAGGTATDSGAAQAGAAAAGALGLAAAGAVALRRRNVLEG